MTNHPDVFAALAAPFHPSDVKERAGGNGRKLRYITAATACNRLDDVLGPESWDFDIAPWGDGALIGTITVRLPDGTVVRKSNVGGRADMQAADDDAKSAASDCLKRCATMLGVGRYLSGDGVPQFSQGLVTEPAAQRPAGPPAGRGDAYEDDLPPERGRAGDRQGAEPRRQQGGNGSPPRSGKALFAFAKEMEQKHNVGLLRYLQGFMKLQDLPARMVDLDADQVALVYGEAMRKLSTLEGAA